MLFLTCLNFLGFSIFMKKAEQQHPTQKYHHTPQAPYSLFPQTNQQKKKNKAKSTFLARIYRQLENIRPSEQPRKYLLGEPRENFQFLRGMRPGCKTAPICTEVGAECLPSHRQTLARTNTAVLVGTGSS